MKNRASIFFTVSILLHGFLAFLLLKESSQSSKDSVSFSVFELAPVAAKKTKAQEQTKEHGDEVAKSKKLEPPEELTEDLLAKAGSESANSGQAQLSQKGSTYLNLEIRYPALSLKAREEGRVEYLLQFSKDFKLLSYKKTRSSGFERLDGAVEMVLAQNLTGSGLIAQSENLIIDFRLRSSEPQILFSSK